MRKIVIFILLGALTLTFSGCDMFRKLAGRPTSADIAAKKAAIELAEKNRKAEQEKADSLERAASTAGFDMELVGWRELKPESRQALGSKYYIVSGVFGKRSNAESLRRQIEAKGYETALLEYANGMIAVGVCPSSSLSEAFSSLENLKKEEFCPKEAWIFENI